MRLIFLSTIYMMIIVSSPILNDEANAQDTLKVGLADFIQLANEQSSLIQTHRSDIDLAKNRLQQVQSQRFIPRIELTTAHGLVPGVRSDIPGLPRDQYYLDPDLRNDWFDWGFFNRAEITTLQPLYTWGALGNAINAARHAVHIAEYEFQAKKSDYEMRLYELYYARLLSLELLRLTGSAMDKINQAERELEKMIAEGSTELEDADLFQFQIFKHEFLYRVDEVRETARFLNSAWNLALNNHSDSVIYLPEESFLDPLDVQIMDLTYYEDTARSARPEILQISSAMNAARYALEATKAQNYPSLFMGFSASIARTPNRPRQSNPFIRNNTNYEVITYGIGFRQNLNFHTNRISIDRAELQLRQTRYARESVHDGVILDIRDSYRNMMMSLSRLDNTRQALQISNEWLRLEQIEYDLGFGEVKKLVDAVKANLELEVSYKQRIFDFNVNIGKLHKAAGIPLFN